MPLHDDYESNLRDAKEFENFVSDTLMHECAILACVYRGKHHQVLYGESRTGIEIKYDKKFRQSGNLFIETAESCHQSKALKKAGIYHPSDPWLFVIGDYSSFWVFATTTLRLCHERGSHRKVSTPTSEGMLLPIEAADEIRAFKWEA